MQTSSTYTAEFKASVIRELLFNAALTEEFTRRHGVPLKQVRSWVRQAAVRMREAFADRTPSQPSVERGGGFGPDGPPAVQQHLSASELEMLLGGGRR